MPLQIITEDLTAEQVYEMFKDDSDLYAHVDEFGFARKPCVGIRGYDDKVLAVIFPKMRQRWETHFNAIVALNKPNAVIIPL